MLSRTLPTPGARPAPAEPRLVIEQLEARMSLIARTAVPARLADTGGLLAPIAGALSRHFDQLSAACRPENEQAGHRA